MKSKFTSLFIVLILLVVFWLIFYFISQFLEKEKSEESLLKPAGGEKFEEGLPSKVFKISGGEGIHPQFFKEIIFKPGKVATGDTQIFSIWIKDPVGVEKVIAEIKTDLGIQEVDLELIKGDNKEGFWQGKWYCCGILKNEYYEIVFKAKSLNGDENTFTGFIENKEYIR